MVWDITFSSSHLKKEQIIPAHCPLNTALSTDALIHSKGNTTKQGKCRIPGILRRKMCQTASAATAKPEPEAELQKDYYTATNQACTFWILFYDPLSTAWRFLRDDCQEVKKPLKQLL